MAIDFELSEGSKLAQSHYHAVAKAQMRPISRRYDLAEHTLPSEWVDYWWQQGRRGPTKKTGLANDGFITVCLQAEELCWGDAGLYLRMPTPALGGSAVSAAGTDEQKQRFMSPFRAEGGHPIWGAMAITESQAGSDAAAIETTADFDPDTEEWILNGTKIFCTAGEGASTVDGDESWTPGQHGLVVEVATAEEATGAVVSRGAAAIPIPRPPRRPLEHQVQSLDEPGSGAKALPQGDAVPGGGDLGAGAAVGVHVGAAEPVDGLLRVADDPDVGRLLGGLPV